MANQNPTDMVARMAKAKQEALNELTDVQNASVVALACSLANMASEHRKAIMTTLKDRLVGEWADASYKWLSLTVAADHKKTTAENGAIRLFAERIEETLGNIEQCEQRCAQFVSLRDLVVQEAHQYGFAEEFQAEFEEWGFHGMPGTLTLDVDAIITGAIE